MLNIASMEFHSAKSPRSSNLRKRRKNMKERTKKTSFMKNWHGKIDKMSFNAGISNENYGSLIRLEVWQPPITQTGCFGSHRKVFLRHELARQGHSQPTCQKARQTSTASSFRWHKPARESFAFNLAPYTNCLPIKQSRRSPYQSAECRTSFSHRKAASTTRGEALLVTFFFTKGLISSCRYSTIWQNF